MSDIPTVSTEFVLDSLIKPNCQIIDVRAIDAYNGWMQDEDLRGGHIPGARSLPVKWSQYIDWIEILMKKEILPEQEIVIYGDDREDIENVAQLFIKNAYPRVFRYYEFAGEWLNNKDMPIEILSRYKHLVSPKWLNMALSGDKPQHMEGKNLVLCHCHYRNPNDYDKGHISGAIALDTLQLESSETWNRRSPEELKNALEKHGICSETTVVVYGRFSFPDNNDPFPGSSAGHLGAIRCAFIMMYAGVKDVKVLNGGLQSWTDDGFKITEYGKLPEPINEFGVVIPQCPELAVDLPQAKEMLVSDTADLVCVRSWDEYIGKVSGYNYIEKTGRIPGAVFGNCGSDAYHMENYRNLDHTTLEYHDILKQWEEVNILPGNHNAFYCGTGWRGSEAFFNAWLIGWPRVSVFDGGWFEWSNDPENQVETGEPD